MQVRVKAFVSGHSKTVQKYIWKSGGGGGGGREGEGRGRTGGGGKEGERGEVKVHTRKYRKKRGGKFAAVTITEGEVKYSISSPKIRP